MFEDTRPASLDALGSGDGLAEFRVSAPGEIRALLKQLMDEVVPLNLSASDGSAYTTTLWTVDPANGRISFTADLQQPAVHDIVEADECVAVAYLDRIKVQFDVSDLVLVQGPKTSVLQARLPRELFRFQRRSAYRVRPVLRSSPMARVRHSEIAEMQLALRVIDVSIGGCALFLPDDVPPMQPGVVLNQVLIELDADTRFHVNLRLQHVTSLNSESP
ncbi:MAG: flagellar regulator YcgR PilZN domain-containing protein, partial [Rhizobacter sp.]